MPTICAGFNVYVSTDIFRLVLDIIQSYIKREQLECSSYPSQSNSPSCPLGGLSPTLGIGTGDISDILNMLKDEDVGNIQPFLHEYNNVDSSTSGQSVSRNQ